MLTIDRRIGTLDPTNILPLQVRGHIALNPVILWIGIMLPDSTFDDYKT
jgi:hypothetical protein